MEHLAAIAFPEIVISISYLCVAIFSGYGTWLFSKENEPVLACLLGGISLIFVFCDLSYILTALNIDPWVINIEHYFVAAGGTIAAIGVSPLSLKALKKEFADLKGAQKLREKSDNLSGFCRVVVRWNAIDDMTILEISQSMISWFIDYAIAPASALAPGNNWVNALPHRQEWLEKNQQTALGGVAWRNQETIATIKGQTISFSWSMFLIDPQEKIMLIEWYDSSDFARQLKDAETKALEQIERIKLLQESLTQLQSIQLGLLEEKMREIQGE